MTDTRWATVGGSQVEEPPGAKKIQGWNAGEPGGAEFLNWWMNKMGGLGIREILSDADKTFVYTDAGGSYFITPTTTRVLTLPTTSVVTGDRITIHNLSTTISITIEPSGGADMLTFQKGTIELMALQDTPTIGQHWRVLNFNGVNILSDAAQTFEVHHLNIVNHITPTAARNLSLPFTTAIAGDRLKIINLSSSQRISLKAGDGDNIAQFLDGWVEVEALQDSPETVAHWRVLDGGGGARPRYRADLNASDQLDITGFQKVDFDNEVYDNNANYDISSARFTPLVLGVYKITARILWKGGTFSATHALQLAIYQNGSSVAIDIRTGVDAPSQSNELEFLIEVTDLTVADFFEVFAQNSSSDTSDIGGDVTFSFVQGSLVSYL